MHPKEAIISDIEEFKKLVQNISFKRADAHITSDHESANNIEDDIMEVFCGEDVIDDVQPIEADLFSTNVILPSPAFNLPQTFHKWYIFSLPIHSLKQPLEIESEIDEDGNVIVWNKEFGLSGIGRTQEKAISEFEDLIYADYGSLKAMPKEKLSKGAKELLEKYFFYLG